MLNFLITDIELKMPCVDFETLIRDELNNVNGSMNCDIKYVDTRTGKHMCRISLDNSDSNVSICAEQDDVTGDYIFHPLKLKSLNESFYCGQCDDDVRGTHDDAFYVLGEMLESLCSKHNGKIAYIDANNRPVLIVNGHKRTVKGLGIVDENNNVFSNSGGKVIGESDNGAGFTVTKPINEWLSEHLDVQQKVANIPAIPDKMNFIGKYLIQAKVNDEIDADEFMDIFRQAGIFGFTEPSILNIYKLIM